MAGAITHLLVAEEAAARAAEEIPELGATLAGSGAFLMLGSVSPDLPYSAVLSKQKAWADRMHYVKTNGIGCYGAVDCALRNPPGTAWRNVQLAWLAGFIAHCVTDATIHPVVQAIVGPYQAAPDEHRACEMIQDSLLFMEVQGKDLRGSHYVDQLKACVHPDQNGLMGVIGFWFSQLDRVYGELDPEPRPQEWYDAYVDLVDLASDSQILAALSRPFKGASSYLYKTARGLRRAKAEEVRRCFDEVPLPNDPPHTATFKEACYQKAIDNLLAVWRAFWQDVLDAKSLHEAGK